MIHVQIASDITAVGVSGVRWVLVEPAPQPGPAALTPAATLSLAHDMPPASTEGQQLRLGLFKLLLVLAGLGLALGLASLRLGAPTLPAQRGADTAKPALPAASAAAGMPLRTAGLP